ncbi:hypothetical protein SCOR_08660 [Sulfidibacter corallicola]|uniref:Uncharacterized protein n=1 Tax=Sulfidibacter corallicola TaxID=2818388 RepID=A0A8A4TQG3_SULCO|nr:hypothetical protein [Sulfidibacter corallicola]QTD51171.1 hypothetical protein J3U87_01770 [Sulfidibacter corallicola]
MMDSDKLTKKFKTFMLARKSYLPKFESPLAVYEWFLSAWGKPLRERELHAAYLAAWEFSFATGVVKL